MPESLDRTLFYYSSLRHFLGGTALLTLPYPVEYFLKGRTNHIPSQINSVTNAIDYVINTYTTFLVEHSSITMAVGTAVLAGTVYSHNKVKQLQRSWHRSNYKNLRA